MSTPLLSAKLVELRQQFGYSQQDVADYLGMTREVIAIMNEMQENLV